MASQIRQEVLDQATRFELNSNYLSPEMDSTTMSPITNSSHSISKIKEQKAKPEIKKRSSPMHKLLKQTHFSKKRTETLNVESKKSSLDRSMMSQKSKLLLNCN